MHIVVFYQYYHSPDCPASARHYTFVREWSANHRVTVITGDSWHGRRLSDRFDWSPPGVTVKMLKVPYDNAMSQSERLRSFARYAWGAIRVGRRLDTPDVVFGTSTPLSAAWAAARVARSRGTKWIFEVRDLWPDFPIQMGSIPSPWLRRSLRRVEERLYRSAAHVVTLSPDMADHVKGCGIDPSHVSTLVNGTDFYLLESVTEGEIAELRTSLDLAGKKVVLYAGTFGRANAIRVILEAAALEKRDEVRFVLIGDGYYDSEVREAAAELPNVIAPQPLPRHAIFKWFRLADITLVPFIDLPVLAANSPSKFFDSLGAGTPVIVTNPGWTKAFVETHECGWYVPPEDPQTLSSKIDQVLNSPWELARAGVNGRRVAVEEFDRIKMAHRVEEIMLAS